MEERKDRKDEGGPSRDRARGLVHVLSLPPINTGCVRRRKCSGSAGFGWGASEVVIKALSPCLHGLLFEVSRYFLEASAAGGARGGPFYLPLSGALCRSLLSRPNYTISTVAKVGIFGVHFWKC